MKLPPCRAFYQLQHFCPDLTNIQIISKFISKILISYQFLMFEHSTEAYLLALLICERKIKEKVLFLSHYVTFIDFLEIPDFHKFLQLVRKKNKISGNM